MGRVPRRDSVQQLLEAAIYYSSRPCRARLDCLGSLFVDNECQSPQVDLLEMRLAALRHQMEVELVLA